MTRGNNYFRLQFIIFALVSASFTNIYITQPVLPVLQNEFSANAVVVSFSVSAVILGIAIANLPFGFLADRISINPIICAGGVMVAIGGLICAVTNDFWILIGICTGFFTVHSAAVGSLNRRLSSGQGRANALYVLFYYLGGWLGITCSGLVFKQGGWQALIYFCASFLLIPLSIGISERKSKHSKDYRNS